MTWSTTSDVRVFLDTAGDFLRSRPVDNTVLLTEAAYLAARPDEAADQRYGWWRSGGDVAGAFVQAPRHPPVLSMMPDDAAESFVDYQPGAPAMGVDGRLVDVVAAARRRRGAAPRERSRIRLYRLGQFHPPALPPGRARVATDADRDLLVTWFEQLMAAFPDDPSDLAYVIDDPLSYGGIVLWEVGGTPVAMAGRSRLVAGMVRLSAVHAPAGAGHDRAAFVAACEAARALARDVLVFAGTADTDADATYRHLGFEPVLDRVMLGE